MPVTASSRTLAALGAAAAAVVLSACGTMATPASFSQDALPDAVKVPAGNKVSLETVGVGQITYECRVKKDTTDQFEWVFVGPDAKLFDRASKQLGRYYGPPATWESSDGSKLTGAQVAVSPAGAGNIPLQLVKANPASGPGVLQGVTFIQRVAIQGGVAPAAACVAGNKGEKQIVTYQADYIFWKAI
ncbi:MAG TPA: DUF3455 domain-containing protein [Burkholderiaceae bacterium]